ncbi:MULTISPECIES: phenylacetic acid degradation operon negative regulatory protein PaaX [unclassified Marinobacterium]|uniref:phenylacetic acid degradation operon negative regulatory protein PaaX n=1 Tax=unclassified Marinobacterium TaxID=2644139 RepID=UPI0015686DFB|nr:MULTISPECIES: phenylacetic acid degradation operon negative regulatory protein PaaX [unclassified Marinobacterium]NRP52954.1 Transcriptional repressor PaaX [Marinobacterium sp. xm-v-242]NRP77535.1 Transcriptional repressor PaaX [Marinobacterium sp. xm-m-383]
MQQTLCADLCIQRFQSQTPLRVPSLIISVWGDSIVAHGGEVWLGSLIRLLEPFGINERLMRTSVFRLTQEGWLLSHKVGRKSFYRLSPDGEYRFSAAFNRVYRLNVPQWQGVWTLLLISALTADEKKSLSDELSLSGFGSLSNSVLAFPQADRDDVISILRENGLADRVVLFESQVVNESEQALRNLIWQGWGLKSLNDAYIDFVDFYQSLNAPAMHAQLQDPKTAFITRTLMIHEYRKLALRDPSFPDQILGSRWLGNEARSLCASLYKQLTPAAHHWIINELEGRQGKLPPISNDFLNRFDGINV